MGVNSYPSTLNFIAHPAMIEQFINGAFMAKTGLAGDFSISKWPFEYIQLAKKTSNQLADLLKKEGQAIGLKYKHFNGGVTRFTPDDIDSLWPTANKFWGSKINDAWGSSVQIPGIASLTMQDIEPITFEAFKVKKNVVSEAFEDELRLRIKNIILPDLFGKVREIMYYTWRTDFKLYREGDDPMREMKQLSLRRKEKV